MKNLLHCHSKNLHSFPISFLDGMYKRVFYATEEHNLWKVDPLEIAIHPHHVDIKITVLYGTLFNIVYAETSGGAISELFKTFKWNSHIQNGNGGFEAVGEAELLCIRMDEIKAGQSVTMKACELHTVFVEQGKKCVWLIEETRPTCDYFPINYSNVDLSQWTPDGLYVEVGDDVKDEYLKNYNL